MNPKVVITHMTNTKEAVKWAVESGSNGIEMDLQFDENNQPSLFQHSKHKFQPCDCTDITKSLDHDHVCSNMGVRKTEECCASTNAKEMLNFIATNFASQIAVVYIDSKISETNSSNLYEAGQNLITFLDKNLFAKGYIGQVIISAEKNEYFTYIKSANKSSKTSSNSMNYFFTLDGLRGKIVNAVQPLISIDAQRVYSFGISSLIPMTFYNELEISVKNVNQGTLSGTIIWTVDKVDDIQQYFNAGADALITNCPSRAIQTIKDRDFEYAVPKTKPAFKKSTSTHLLIL